MQENHETVREGSAKSTSHSIQRAWISDHRHVVLACLLTSFKDKHLVLAKDRGGRDKFRTMSDQVLEADEEKRAGDGE